jgi:hypothetical protein
MSIETTSGWVRNMTAGKQAFNAGNFQIATKFFCTAADRALTFGQGNMRRNVSVSWLALCYAESGSNSLAESYLNELLCARDVLQPGVLQNEILNNLEALATVYEKRGKVNYARHLRYVMNQCASIGPVDEDEGEPTQQLLGYALRRAQVDPRIRHAERHSLKRLRYTLGTIESSHVTPNGSRQSGGTNAQGTDHRAKQQARLGFWANVFRQVNLST